jgi:hypothetical protein
MKIFVCLSLERQLAVARTKTLKEVEDAVANAGPLAVIHERKANDVPYFRAGSVWRRIQEHLGVIPKTSESQWKHQWTSTFKAKYFLVRKDSERWHEVLAADTVVWLAEASTALKERIDELTKKLDVRPVPTDALVEEIAPMETVCPDPAAAVEHEAVPMEDGGLCTTGIDEVNAEETSQVTLVKPLAVPSGPGFDVLWQWVSEGGAVPDRGVDGLMTFDEVVSETFDSWAGGPVQDRFEAGHLQSTMPRILVAWQRWGSRGCGQSLTRCSSRSMIL